MGCPWCGGSGSKVEEVKSKDEKEVGKTREKFAFGGRKNRGPGGGGGKGEVFGKVNRKGENSRGTVGT